MATLNIGGKRVKVDDSFLKLTPEQQQATVEEIAASMGGAPNAADEAMANASRMSLKGKPTPPNRMVSPLPGVVGQVQDFSNAAQSGFNQGLTFGFGDEIFAGVAAPFRAAGGALQGQGFDLGKAYEEELAITRGAQGQQAALNPVASAAGEVTGAIVNPLSRLAGGPLSKAATPVGKALVGAAEGSALGGLYGFGKGETMDERLSGATTGALTGGVLGGVTPAVTGAVGNMLTKGAQKRATTAAIKGAPSAADLKAASSALFQKVDQSGVTIEPTKFGNFVANLVMKAGKDRMNPTLDPKAYAAMQEIALVADEAMKRGGGLTVSDLHTLRQIAQKAAQSADGRDAMFANRIVDGLDDFVTQPGSTVLPPNRLGQGNNTAGNDLLEAISTWGRSRRVGLIETAIRRGEAAASGAEIGIRNELRRIVKDRKLWPQFSKPEQQAILDVVGGASLANLTRLASRMGGAIGGIVSTATAGPLVGLATLAAGSAAKKVSANLTRNAAERAAQVVATPNIPTVAAGPKQIAMQELMQRLGLAGGGPLATQN